MQGAYAFLLGGEELREKKPDKKFYLVREDVLPEAMKKTIDAKALIDRGKVDSVWEAVQKVDLSRSAFYKYRDTVFPFHTVVKERLITLFIYLEDRSGTLSNLLTTVASTGCNVLTINQTIPLQGRANITLALNVENMEVDIEELLKRVRQLEFVEKVEVLGSGV